jgi:membrane protein required for colicin V production
VTLFDVVVLAILGASLVLGLVRGLVREVLSLASWLLAFVLANAYSAQLAQMLPAAIPGETVRVMVAFVALFIGVRLLAGLASSALAALVSAVGLGLLDRGLGALFGLGRGVVIVLALVMVCALTSMPQQPFWKHAVLAPAFEAGARMVKPFLPAALAQRVPL